MKRPNRHKQVKVKNARILVDEDLVPLLKVLWDRGITTLYSCQGGEIKTRQGRTLTMKSYILMTRDSESMKLVEKFINDKNVQIELDYNIGHGGYRITLRFNKKYIKKLTRRLNRKRS